MEKTSSITPQSILFRRLFAAQWVDHTDLAFSILLNLNFTVVVGLWLCFQPLKYLTQEVFYSLPHPAQHTRLLCELLTEGWVSSPKIISTKSNRTSRKLVVGLSDQGLRLGPNPSFFHLCFLPNPTCACVLQDCCEPLGHAAFLTPDI